MKNRFRKLVSLVSAVVMLLAVLPICAASVTAATNIFPDGGFENGTVGSMPDGWNQVKTTVTVTTDAARSGSKSLLVPASGNYQTNAYINFNVEPNTAYSFTFYYSSVSASALADGMATIVDNSNENQLKRTWMNHSDAMGGSTWRKMTMDFVSGDSSSLRFELAMAEQGDGVYTPYYVDDIVCYAKPTIENGDFETGAAGGSLAYTSSNTKVTNAAAHNGSYSLKLDARNGWNTSAAINVSVVPNTDYVITLYYSYVSSSATLPVVIYFYDGTYSNSDQTNINAANGGKQLTASLNDATAVNGTTWAKKTITFNSGANSGSVWMKFSDNGSGSSPCYIDDVTCRKISVSDDGYIKNGDFEYLDWSTHWTNINSACTIALVDGYESSQALSVKAGKWQQVRQKFSVKANTDYNVTLWAKNTSDITMIFKTGSTDANYLQTSISAGSTWTKISYNFNSGDNTSLYLGFMGNDSGNGTAILDDITIVELKDPSFDGWLYNGDFEAGSLTKWSPAQSTQISKNAAHTGNFGAQLKGNGSYGGLLDQTFNTVVGVSYKVTIWVKGVSAGCNFTFKDSSGNKLGDDASFYASADNSADWKQWTAEFVATTSTTLLNICGGGTGIAEDVYVDDIVVTALMADPVSGGQTSVSEDVSGLQFKFDVAATGVTAENNEYDAGSGKVTPYKDCATTYSLVGMGAVVTNLASVGGSIDKMVLESVDGSNKVISIPVVYLYEYDQTSVSFAVRITNIPDTKYDTFVYARAYFIFEDGRGNQFTIYDDQVMKQTYNGANA